MATLKVLAVALALFLTAVLSVQNAAPAALKFLFWRSIEMPVGVLLTLSLCVGLLSSLVIFPVRGRT
ncbi:MAG: lipopolysaccharide assembly protein LapA domain-containing protein [Cyanobacteria bacterium P01_F01_bin.42]